MLIQANDQASDPVASQTLNTDTAINHIQIEEKALDNSKLFSPVSPVSLKDLSGVSTSLVLLKRSCQGATGSFFAGTTVVADEFKLTDETPSIPSKRYSLNLENFAIKYLVKPMNIN